MFGRKRFKEPVKLCWHSEIKYEGGQWRVAVWLAPKETEYCWYDHAGRGIALGERKYFKSPEAGREWLDSWGERFTEWITYISVNYSSEVYCVG